MTGRYVWSEDPERHLDDWADSSDDHTVDYAEFAEHHPDGTYCVRWICTASDLEPCARGKVRHLTRGSGLTRAAAADVCLTRIAEHALERAQAHLKPTQPQETA